MGSCERYQKNQSIQFAAKNLAAFIFLIAASCSHKNSVPPEMKQVLSQTKSSDVDVTSLGLQLTRFGENSSPFLSKDGKRLVYVSRKRPSHSQGQIYFYDLESLKEKRITFQDGDCSDPLLLENGKELVYASTTDELKERPQLLKKNKDDDSVHPMADLYQSDLSGFDIERLTQRRGFDGHPVLIPGKSKMLLYSQWDGKQMQIWQLNLENEQSSLFLSKKNVSITSISPSPDGKKWAWIEQKIQPAANEPATQVYVGTLPLKSENLQPLNLPRGDYKEVTWMTDQKIVLTGLALKKNFQLYSLDLQNQCLQSLVDSNSDLSSPQFHPDQKGLIFTSVSKGNSHIYYKSLTTSAECLKWQESSQK